MSWELHLSELLLLTICFCLCVCMGIDMRVPEDAERELQIPRVAVRVGWESLGWVLAT